MRYSHSSLDKVQTYLGSSGRLRATCQGWIFTQHYCLILYSFFFSFSGHVRTVWSCSLVGWVWRECWVSVPNTFHSNISTLAIQFRKSNTDVHQTRYFDLASFPSRLPCLALIG